MERVWLRDRDDLQLPDDLLADVLRRLPPRHLAASRCVREGWRRVIDERRLLRSDLLPLSLAGIFIQLDGHGCPEFFSRRPSSVACASATASTRLQDFLPPTEYPFGEVSDADPFDNEDYFVRDHCNGLLLTYTYVVNPATRRWSVLSTPQRPLADLPRIVWYYNDYLSFDPTVSLHYQVFSIPCLCFLRATEDVDPLMEESEWPPSTWILNVFSSSSGRWEERSFAREGDSAGSIAEARPHYGWPKCGAAYWRQALYVHCQTNFLVRIDLSDDKYRVIKPPMSMDTKTHLGRSKHGVYYASFGKDVFRVWILDESYGQIKWMLKGELDLKRVPALDQHVHGPWILQDISYELFCVLKFQRSIRNYYLEENLNGTLTMTMSMTTKNWLESVPMDVTYSGFTRTKRFFS
ncbi:hypothetical protein ACQ4PT_058997 [Festuca glaucescens]